MSIEDQLRDSLRRRAASVRPRPDLDDVGARTATRERRTRRFLTAGLVVALIAGPLAGFAVARAGDGGGSDVATGGRGGGRELATGAGDAAISAALPTDRPLEKLFLRTTGDGIVIRAYRSAAIRVPVPLPACPPGTECAAAPECATMPMITGELSTDEAVTVAHAGAGQASDDDIFVATAEWSTFGVAEGAPTRWLIASVSPGVARVRASFAGAATDEMEPVDGIAILAGRVTDPDGGSGTLEAIAGDGSVLHRIDIVPGTGSVATSSSSASGSSSGSAESSAELRTESSASGSGASANASSSVSSSGSADTSSSGASCAGPLPTPAPAPTLPPPAEQPADPASARTEIEQAFATSFDDSISAEASARYEEGPPGEFAGSCFAAQASHTTAKVTDVVFTSATEAFVRYDISTDDPPSQFRGQSGTALLLEGRWKVSHQTACAAARLGR